MQEQGAGSSPIDNDPVGAGNSPVVDTHTTDSPIRHADGKEIICLAYSSTIIMNKNLPLPLQISVPEI